MMVKQTDGKGTTCRICLQPVDKSEVGKKRFVTPCKCTGSIGTIHVECFKSWLKYRKSNKCEICQSQYNLKLKAIGSGNYFTYVADDLSAGPIVAFLCSSGFYCWLLFKLNIVTMNGIGEELAELASGHFTPLNTIGSFAGSLAITTWSSMLVFHLNRFRHWRKKNVTYELIEKDLNV